MSIGIPVGNIGNNTQSYYSYGGGKYEVIPSSYDSYDPTCSEDIDPVAELANQIPLLNDDRLFIHMRLLRLSISKPNEIQFVCDEYKSQWVKGDELEDVRHKKDNAARFRANVWLRELTGVEIEI